MYRRILVPVDASPAAAAAAREASRLARASRGTVHLLSVVDHDLVYSGGLLGVHREAYRKALEAAAAKLLTRLARGCARAGARCRTHVAAGRVVPTILRQAVVMRADLIVLGSKQRGRLAGLVLGDRTREVVRSARAPVLLVPARGAGAGKRASRAAGSRRA
jgi:nucleotide-binding universal stress UspA family protein